MNLFWAVVLILYLGLVTVAVGLSTWHAFRPRESSEERIADHIPDPRDTEIAFLRARVVHLEEMLHGTQRDTTVDLADMLRASLVGTGTGLSNEAGPIITTDAPVDALDPIDDDEGDWTDDFIADDAGLPFVPPPPPGFPAP